MSFMHCLNVNIVQIVIFKMHYAYWVKVHKKDTCLSIVRLNGESQNGGYKKTKQNFPENEHFLPHDTRTYLCVLLRHKRHSISRKFDMLCFLLTTVLRFFVSFCLITDQLCVHFKRFHTSMFCFYCRF